MGRNIKGSVWNRNWVKRKIVILREKGEKFNRSNIKRYRGNFSRFGWKKGPFMEKGTEAITMLLRRGKKKNKNGDASGPGG